MAPEIELHKDWDGFAPLRAALTNLHAWGGGQIGSWLEQGVRSAFDGLADAGTHITTASATLAVVNAALEGEGLDRARMATGALEQSLGALDAYLALRDASTGTDWLTAEAKAQLAKLADEVLSH